MHAAAEHEDTARAQPQPQDFEARHRPTPEPPRIDHAPDGLQPLPVEDLDRLVDVGYPPDPDAGLLERTGRRPADGEPRTAGIVLEALLDPAEGFRETHQAIRRRWAGSVSSASTAAGRKWVPRPRATSSSASRRDFVGRHAR